MVSSQGPNLKPVCDESHESTDNTIKSETKEEIKSEAEPASTDSKSSEIKGTGEINETDLGRDKRQADACEEEREHKRMKVEEDPEVSEAIEEKTILVSGEGAGQDCKEGNPYATICNDFEIGEAIEEPILYIKGPGSGHECGMGNPTNSDETEKSEKPSDDSSKSIALKGEGESILKAESESVMSTNGTIDNLPVDTKEKESSNVEDDSELDFLKTGFYFGPGTLAAKDRIPMGSPELKPVQDCQEAVVPENKVSETDESVETHEQNKAGEDSAKCGADTTESTSVTAASTEDTSTSCPADATSALNPKGGPGSLGSLEGNNEGSMTEVSKEKLLDKEAQLAADDPTKPSETLDESVSSTSENSNDSQALVQSVATIQAADTSTPMEGVEGVPQKALVARTEPCGSKGNGNERSVEVPSQSEVVVNLCPGASGNSASFQSGEVSTTQPSTSVEASTSQEPGAPVNSLMTSPTLSLETTQINDSVIVKESEPKLGETEVMEQSLDLISTSKSELSQAPKSSDTNQPAAADAVVLGQTCDPSEDASPKSAPDVGQPEEIVDEALKSVTDMCQLKEVVAQEPAESGALEIEEPTVTGTCQSDKSAPEPCDPLLESNKLTPSEFLPEPKGLSDLSAAIYEEIVKEPVPVPKGCDFESINSVEKVVSDSSVSAITDESGSCVKSMELKELGTSTHSALTSIPTVSEGTTGIISTEQLEITSVKETDVATVSDPTDSISEVKETPMDLDVPSESNTNETASILKPETSYVGEPVIMSCDNTEIKACNQDQVSIIDTQDSTPTIVAQDSKLQTSSIPVSIPSSETLTIPSNIGEPVALPSEGLAHPAGGSDSIAPISSDLLPYPHSETENPLTISSESELSHPRDDPSDALDDGPPAITTLEDAMRQMEAAGAPVCLDDSDDDDHHVDEVCVCSPSFRSLNFQKSRLQLMLSERVHYMLISFCFFQNSGLIIVLNTSLFSSMKKNMRKTKKKKKRKKKSHFSFLRGQLEGGNMPQQDAKKMKTMKLAMKICFQNWINWNQNQKFVKTLLRRKHRVQSKRCVSCLFKISN